MIIKGRLSSFIFMFLLPGFSLTSCQYHSFYSKLHSLKEILHSHSRVKYYSSFDSSPELLSTTRNNSKSFFNSSYRRLFSPYSRILLSDNNNSNHSYKLLATPFSQNNNTKFYSFSSTTATTMVSNLNEHSVTNNISSYVTMEELDDLSNIIKPTSQESSIHLHFNLNPKEIQSISSLLIEKSKKILNKIGQLPSSQRTFQTVIEPLGYFEGRFHTITSSLTFPQHVSTDKQVRAAAVDANKLIEDFSIEISMRKDLYEAVLTVHKSINENVSIRDSLEPEDLRLVTKMIEKYERAGLLLPAASQNKLKAIKKRLSSLTIEFSQNINEDTTFLLFTKEELIGCVEDFFDSLEKVSERDGVQGDYYKVTMKYPDYFGLMRYASNELTRKKMDTVYGSRCVTNADILVEALKLRQEAAMLLGYKDNAAFVLHEHMAKSSTTVNKFLNDLVMKLQPLLTKEREVMTKMKASEQNDNNMTFQTWDYQYYHRKLQETFNVDNSFICQFFEFDNVTNRMLKIYETVLSLKFVEMKNDPSIWHSDIRLFQVLDTRNVDKKSTEENPNESLPVVGYFYLDLFPREGKFSHAACFGLQSGFYDPIMKYQIPVAVMVANMKKPTPQIPSLLNHDELLTYFHELGHVMHHICSKVKYQRFHGTSVETDFVEAPSQMLENWVWDKQSLQGISEHYKDEDNVLPSETIDALIKTKLLNVGHYYCRQIFFAKFDMSVHSADEPGKGGKDWTSSSLKKHWKALRKEVTHFDESPETFGANTFGHIMGGYDAGYYGYLWSLVVSTDMFYSRFKNAGLLDPKTGLDYRHCILQPGASKDATEMIYDFLGRESNECAFLKSLGLTEK